ncbi:MAG: hypothetical protein QXK88_01245 [Desulfurococcaceae archaeon]
MDSKRYDDVVIRALKRLGECNLNALRKETGLSYYTLAKSISRLISQGIIAEKRIGRLRLFKLIEGRGSA